MATDSVEQIEQSKDGVDTLESVPRSLSPDSELAQEVSAIFSLHLEGRDVVIEDDFFELGGNSMIGIKIIDQISRDYGVELSVRAFYLAQTPLKVAELITRGRLKK